MSGLAVELRPFRLPLRVPLRTTHGEVADRQGVLFGIDDGTHAGWGEAAPMPGWSSHDLPATVDALAAVAASMEVIDGVDDPRLQEILDELEELPHARAALAGALADIGARALGVSVAASLASAPAPLVAVNALAAAPTPDGVAQECAAALAAGYSTVKLKVGVATPSVDRDRVAAARDALGTAAGLRIDANGAWDVDTAVALLDDLAAHDVMWCEEPTDGVEAIAAVGARSAVPVAVDESARSVDDIARALGTGTVDVVVVKPQALGGPDLAVRAIRLATEVGATAVVTSMIDGAIGVAHAVHVAAAGGVDLAHGLGTSSLLADDVAAPLPVADGCIVVPDGPGLGVVPD